MAAEAKRDFSNFILGDNVYELANGLVPEIAERAGLDPGDQPSSDILFRLVGIIGKNKVLRKNAEIDFLSQRKMANYVDQSGILLPLNRSLWLPDQTVPENAAKLITGGMANWQDRTTQLLQEQAERSNYYPVVYVATGSRVMNTKTEITNPNVDTFHSEAGHYPTESKYAETYVVPALEDAGYEVVHEEFETQKGEEIASQFVAKHPEAFAHGVRLSFVRVAAAGVQLAVQFREAARQVVGRYDSFKHKPQVYIETDTIQVARTKTQRENARNFQAPQNGLRQVILTAKSLHEAAGGQ